jgi:hypothetical protein
MDSAYVSAFAALAGAAIGGLTTFGASWVTQHTQARTQQLTQLVTSRQDLYRHFIEEASRLYADSLLHDAPDVGQLIRLYVLVSQMRAISSDEIVSNADGVAKMIVDAYFEPNKTVADLHEMVNRGAMDPLRDFSESCREEFRRAGYV